MHALALESNKRKENQTVLRTASPEYIWQILQQHEPLLEVLENSF